MRIACGMRKAGLRGMTAGMLCVLLAGQPLMAGSIVAKHNAAEIQGDERILHALNRLTFGPRPGEMAAVKAMGLDRWLDRQLNPSSIDDAALEARLADFPAMKLSQDALMERFPSPQVLRQIDRQDLPLPADPVERTIYSDQLAFYKMAQERKAAKAADGTGKDGKEMTAALPGDMTDPATPAMAAHEEQLYSGLEAVKVINLPPDQRMARILAMSPKELIAFRRSLSQHELAEVAQGLTPEQKEILVALPGSGRLVDGELLQSRLVRDIYSDRQLEAVMTDFWLNHFNIYVKKNQNEPYLLPAFEREVIRPNALGHFEDLLVATAKSPAMLMYLDNWQSIGPESDAGQRAARQAVNAKPKASGLNENYARELMELHTLGVGGGYTQADVTQVAKVFTGWTIERPYRGAAFQFEPKRHEPGNKLVLGRTIRPGSDDGMGEGLDVLHLLATSPATARFISTKLAVRFVADEPPQALVDEMTKMFLASHGDIKAVLRVMFYSPEFWSPAVYRAKVKTPIEFVVSAARASEAEVVTAGPLVQSLDKLGMPLYGMQTPNGYSWKAEPWVSTGELVSRMNFALVLAGDRMQGVRTGLEQMLRTPAGGVQPVALAGGGVPVGDAAIAEKERRLEIFLIGQPVSERTRATVLQQLEDSAAQQQAEKDFPIKAGDPELMAGSLAGGRVGPPFDTTPGAAPAAGPRDLQAEMMAGLLLGSPEFQRR